jgi:hypothetical protein
MTPLVARSGTVKVLVFGSTTNLRDAILRESWWLSRLVTLRGFGMTLLRCEPT